MQLASTVRRHASTGDTSAALAVRNLRKEFQRGATRIVAVDDINFALREGEIMSLLGPNGAGKTTTVKMLCGLIKPTRGSIVIANEEDSAGFGRPVTGVGAVLEGSRNIYWRLTVMENIEYFGACRAVRRADLRKRAKQLLTTLGLEGKRNVLVQTLSRGMQQKVAVACALCTNPRVLLLDEPTLGLDLESSLTIQQEMRRLAHEEGKAIVLTTHHMEIAQAVSTHIAIMSRGRIITRDTVKHLLSFFAKDDVYTIRVQGALPRNCRTDLEGRWAAEIIEGEREATLLVSCGNGDGLYTIVDTLRQCAATILSIQREESDLARVYTHLLERDQ